jgi:hypothetical protein
MCRNQIVHKFACLEKGQKRNEAAGLIEEDYMEIWMQPEGWKMNFMFIISKFLEGNCNKV